MMDSAAVELACFQQQFLKHKWWLNWSKLDSIPFQTPPNLTAVPCLKVFLGVIKIFKYISFNKTMSQLAGTLQRSAPDVGAFFIMFGIVFMAFAQFAFLMFGTKVNSFS